MGRITSFFQSLKQKIKEMTLMRKVAIGVVSAIVLIAIIMVVVALTKTKYVVLYTGLETQDATLIKEQLDEKNVKYKVEGDTFYVSKKVQGKLQAELDSQIDSGTKGLEIFDEANLLGLSEAELNVKYQQGIQGEIEKTLKSLPQISNAKVNVVLSEKSAFVKEADEAKVNATITTVEGVELEDSQVRALVSSISTMVKNLPKENISIIDQNMVDLTLGLLDEESEQGVDFDKRQKAKLQSENEYNKKVSGAFSKIIGTDKFTVTTNVDLDFDEVKKEETETEKDPAKVSDQEEKSKQTTTGDDVTTSPVDDNLNNEAVDADGTVTTAETSNIINNYRTDGKTTTLTSQAPGKEINKSISVAIDNRNLTRAELENYSEYIRNAVGLLDDTSITIIGTEFNPEAKELAQQQLEAMENATKQEVLNKLYIMLAIGVGALILVAILLIVMRNKKKAEELASEMEIEEEGLDVIIADDADDESYKTIDFNQKSEEAIVEDQIKKYAEEKPDQVAEIVKSWLVGDEGGI